MPTPPQTTTPALSPPLFAAWLIALLASAGELFLGEVMGMTPCVLCWYQRIAMFPLALILGIGLLEPDGRSIRYALPLAWAGGGIALYHCLIFWGLISQALSPCGKGGSCADADVQVAGFVPIPLLSLIAFTAIAVLLWSASYAPLHKGSDTAVKILEAARQQGKYWEALEKTMAAQPQWAAHHNPQPEMIWALIGDLGLDMAQAKAAASSPEIDQSLRQDIADMQALKVERTPGFFVNGSLLREFGELQLKALVAQELARPKPNS